MHNSGEITDEHEVWSDDMETWKKLSDIKSQKIHINFKPTAETIPEFHNLDVYSPKIEASSRQRNIAGPWRRFFARIFDVWFFIILVCMPLLFAWAYYSPYTYLSVMPQNEIVLSMGLIFAAFIIDSIAYDCFGNTPGKALLGLKLCKPNNEKYSPKEYLGRNLGVWWGGFALGIPVLSMVSMIIQYRRFKKSGYTLYDVDKKGTVIVEGKSIFKTAIFILLLISMVVINAVVKGL
tara:strand:+ start:173 stop:880 length:708 start_codon:yes stop_codon:yes gene_type:complete